ncbi:MAG: CDP-6-deoxy-delta-3,4-glucoseen reductase [Gammaproteobacteria bacterium]|nr:CDP-6-deoxy-delta-3,4-glucoseen reductase [Gammaproteobacteria bacterium]
MSYSVTVKPSGHQFTVDEDETILNAALRQGLSLPYGCRNGACGACRGKVLEGDIHYGDFEPSALSEDDQANNLGLFCQAIPRSDVTLEIKEVALEEDIQIKTLTATIKRMERLTESVMALWLKLPESERMQFLAGQYIDIIMEDGQKRAFSIANPPHEDATIELHIRHVEGGAFTDKLFNEMNKGDTLEIQGPHGSFFLREESDRPIIMLATGTGFAPVKAIVEHAIAENVQRPIHIYWGERHKDDLYMQALARSWSSNHKNIHFVPVLSQADNGEKWNGKTGHIQDAVINDFDDLSAYEVYACGAPAMVYTARDTLMTKGLDSNYYYSDAFEYAVK